MTQHTNKPVPSAASAIPAPDFRRLFEAAPGLYLVLTPDFIIVATSDAYLRATMTRREDILGRRIFDVFPDCPDDPAATGDRNLRASLERVLGQRAPDVMAVRKYAIHRPEAEGGGFEERCWGPVNSPVFGAGGDVTYIIHRLEDVTGVVRLEQPDQARLRETHALLRAVSDGLTDAVFVKDRQGRYLFINPAGAKFLGRTVDPVGEEHWLAVLGQEQNGTDRLAEGILASDEFFARGLGASG